jgi:hypothetical protein
VKGTKRENIEKCQSVREKIQDSRSMRIHRKKRTKIEKQNGEIRGKME